MLDELKEEAIVNKVGGRFKLSTLIQKRMKALNSGARPLVKVRGGDGRLPSSCGSASSWRRILASTERSFELRTGLRGC